MENNMKMIDLNKPLILNRRGFVLEHGLCVYLLSCYTNSYEDLRYDLRIQQGKKGIRLLTSKDMLRKFANNLLNDIAELEAENEKE